MPITKTLAKLSRKDGTDDRFISCWRVYANGIEVYHRIRKDEVDDWIEYNRTYRFGVALFVNGKCCHHGYLSIEQCEHNEKVFAWVEDLRREYCQ